MPKVPVISIVDDDESVRVALGSLIRSLGFAAQGFASAEAFLQSPRLGETACLISDVQMPDMTGIELQRALIAQGCRIPVIFITAFPDDAVEATAMQAGAVCFLSKPFDARTMITYLDQVLKPDKAGGTGV